MKTLYISIAAVITALSIGLLIWKKPGLFKPSVEKTKNFADRTWGVARSAAGRVANAADELLHTERDDPNQPSQPA